MTFAVYSSPTLGNNDWAMVSEDILPEMSDFTGSPYSAARHAYFIPCGIYNRATEFWVLWFVHPFEKGVAVSRKPGGPYTIVRWNETALTPSADVYLWQNVSSDTALLKTNGGGAPSICTLAGDYLSVSTCSEPFGKELGYTEGGGVFQTEIGDTFAMAGDPCCFCSEGANGYTWRANASQGPLGAYAFEGDKIPFHRGWISPTLAQQFSVAPVHSPGGIVPMYVGVRFGSAPDRTKMHDFQYWEPLSVTTTSNNVSNLDPITNFVNEFTLLLANPAEPPPLPVPPPAPFYLCSHTAGGCVEVPPMSPALNPGAFNTLQACSAACVPCTNLTGEWQGGLNTTDPTATRLIRVEQLPVGSVDAWWSVNITFPSDTALPPATGRVRLGGGIWVGGGWCGPRNICVGQLSSNCSKVEWLPGFGGTGVWQKSGGGLAKGRP